MRELLYSLRWKLLGVLLVAIVIGFGLGRWTGRTPAASGPVPDYFVKLEKNGATPSKLSVTVGQMVEFDSRDGGYHDIVQVTSADPALYHIVPQGYDSGVFAPDEGYQATFLKAGSFILHDHLHPALVINVEVHESTTTPK